MSDYNDNNNTNTNTISDSSNSTDDALKLVIVCVGLPARGKSYITKKLQRYLNWMQYNTKIFNVGNTRRQLNVYIPSNYPIQGPTIDNNDNDEIKEKIDETFLNNNSNLFDHNNKENFQLREKWAKETLNHLLDFLLCNDGNVGIFDATNTTKARRKWIIRTINERTKGLVKILFLESICTDLNLIEKNIHLKLSGPDYKKIDPMNALNDFRQRLKNYEKVYETIDKLEEEENEIFDIQYVKIINAGKKIISYNISGYLSSQCVFFLLNFNLTDRQIWLTTNGESVYNLQNKIGGDSDLTKNGIEFAKALPKFISMKRQEFKLRKYGKEFINDTSTFKTHFKNKINNNNNTNNNNQNFNIWTSTLKRTIETAHYFPKDEFYFKSFKILNDLCCGSLDSINEDDFRYIHSNEYLESLENKLSYRYPGLGGESYLDVISRLRPIITELERLKDHVLIVSHRVIIRVLLCYFMNLNKEMLTELEVQHNYVYCIEPKPYGLDLKIWQYDDITNMFIEADVATIMKRKRKRGSMVFDDVERLRRLLLRNDMNQRLYDSDDVLSIVGDNSGTEIESESESESESSESDSDAYFKRLTPKLLVDRSDSQAYEFIKNSSADLRALGFNSIQSNTDNNNSKLIGSTSVTSMASLASIPSATSLSGLPGVSNLKKHLKGSSSDLRGQAVQAAHAAHTALLSDLSSPAISLSRKSSLRHIKKPSIDWDLFDHKVEIASNKNNNNILPSKTIQRIESTSSGTSSLEISTVVDAEVDLIMSNPLLVQKIKERLKLQKN